MSVRANALDRIIDANLNRSVEGLRVCEEVARFVLESPGLTSQLKSIRHAVARARIRLDARALAGSRDAQGDIGRSISVRGGNRRRGCADIFLANIQRVKESLRVLEEFSKLRRDETLSSNFSRLRFRIYEIEKKAFGRISALRHP